jgi:phenylacetate-CoA ligase
MSDSALEGCETRTLEETLEHSIPLLRNAVERADAASSFWTQRFANQGIKSGDIRTLHDFQPLALLDKKDILDDQLALGPFGTLLAVPPDQLRRIHRTSGTTATPLLVLLTGNDLTSVVSVGSRAFRCSGVEAADIVVHCLNYCMWSGGVSDHESLEAAGATVIPFGVGNSHFLLETILQVRPSALSCTPSYLARLYQLLTDEFKLQPRDLRLRKAFCGGEPGLQDPDFRKSVEDIWGIRAVDANYGLADVLSIMASECDARDGLHFHAHDELLPELVDDAGRPVEISKGATGELVLSNLIRDAQPLFRYRTHDIIEIVDTARCACGRRGFRFRVVGRSDDVVVVKGINFFPAVLQGLIAGYSQLTGEYRVYASKPPNQDLRVEFEKVRGTVVDWTSVAEDIARRVLQQHSVKLRVSFCEYGAIPKSEHKTKRLIRD